MYSRSQIVKKYLRYYFTASNGKGHGIHSPFVFDLISNVLCDKKNYECYPEIESIRQKLLKRSVKIEVSDLGAGSALIKTNTRAVADIARSSLKPLKYSRLLYRLVKYYQPKKILELGTSFGITTSYLASGNASAMVYTIEGAPAIADIAHETFKHLGVKNIELITGNFSDALPVILGKLDTVDLAFIDGNHRRAPTLDYFRQLSEHADADTILIFDDIHWSSEMESAWEVIRMDPAVTLSIDLFFLGIVFFKHDLNHKQEFTIRF